MNLPARQGDLVIEKLEAISGELVEVTDYVFAGYSSGRPHTLLGKTRIRREGRRVLVSIDAPTEMIHGDPSGHFTIPFSVGNYEIRPLREDGDGTDRAVED